MEKEIAKWHKESEETIWDAIEPWDTHFFVCIMSDESIEMFLGMCDENNDGDMGKHLYSETDASSEDINLWIEVEDPNK